MQARVIASMLSVLAMIPVVVGCDRPEIHSYRVPKEQQDPAERSAEVNPELPARAGDATVEWTAPADWKSVQTDQPMRLATFDAGGAEVTVTAFPGPVGGNLANVNRWRGQIGLGPVDEAAVAGLLTTSREGATEISLLTLTGEGGKVLLGAIIVPGDGKTWFAKSITDESHAAAIRDGFAAFAKSFRMQGAASTAPSAQTSASASPTPSPTSAAAAPDIASRLVQFAPPAHWKSEGAGGGIVAAAFSATNDSGGSRITATSLANDGGGDLANINRWRGQLGLAPHADLAAVERSDLVPGLLAVDLRNADGTDRMIAVIVPSDGATWFFKLRGSAAGVEAERTAFAALVRAMAANSAEGGAR